MLHPVRENRRLGFRSADDHTGLVDGGVLGHDLELEIGNIDEDMEFAEIRRQPAPTLHVGEHGIE